ncbi:hypothetical protein [Amycolatopsis rifamycinica]|nr:hypothetical protein [Amycolatopsis rifamycinica]
MVGLLTDPAAVDELRFARLNQEYRRSAPEKRFPWASPSAATPLAGFRST